MKFSNYEEFNTPGLGQPHILAHTDLIEKYELKVDVNGVGESIIAAGLSDKTTVKLGLLIGVQYPGGNTVYASPEYLNPENQSHLKLPEESELPNELSIMSSLIRRAVKLGDARSHKLRHLREQALYRPAIFVGSIAAAVLAEGLDLETGKFIGEERHKALERQLFIKHHNDIQLTAKNS